MTEFSKENLNCTDYDSLNAVWECQLRQLGWQRGWGENGPGWRENENGDVQSAYDAWRQATGTPDDLRLGIVNEPPQPPYHKPV